MTMKKMINPAFVKPPERNPSPIEQPTYFKKELKSWQDIHLAYEFTADTEKKQRHWMLRADHPEHLHTTICRIYRVKIRPGMFEDENGNIVPRDKTPSQCIVYSLSEYVDNPAYIVSGGQTGVNKISGDFYTEGRYTKHIGRFEHDERGNVINSEHLGTRYIHYIEYTPQAIRDLLNKYEHDKTLSFAVCIANEGGSEPYIGTPKTVKNVDEFCDIEDIDGLLAANIGTATVQGSKVGTFLDDRRGGYSRWQKYRQKLDEEGQETEISKLDKSTKKRQYTSPPE